jgi:hypothetical protein
VVGGALVAVGILLLLGRIFDVEAGSVWPLFVIVPGLVLLAIGLGTEGDGGRALTGAGGVVTGVGLVLLYCNLTGRWVAWSYLWALAFPTAIGAALWLHATIHDDPTEAVSARRTLTVGLILLLVFTAFFEGVLGIGGLVPEEARRLVLPVLVIVAGGLVLFSATRKRS